jgi:hypothetical protein
MTSTYVNISSKSSYWVNEPFQLLVVSLIHKFIPKNYESDVSEWGLTLNDHCEIWQSNKAHVSFSYFSTKDFNHIVLAMVKGYQFLDSIMDNENLQEEFVENRIGTGQPVKNLRFYLGEIIELAKKDSRFNKSFCEAEINSNKL